MSDPGEPPFAVLVFDMAKTGEPDGEQLISGFATLDAATSYAIARVRASVEELRKPGIAAAELRRPKQLRIIQRIEPTYSAATPFTSR
ncbi:hypothetical protein ACWGTI_08930 [Mesorhizobium sp. ArgA1]